MLQVGSPWGTDDISSRGQNVAHLLSDVPAIVFPHSTIGQQQYLALYSAPSQPALGEGLAPATVEEALIRLSKVTCFSPAKPRPDNPLRKLKNIGGLVTCSPGLTRTVIKEKKFCSLSTGVEPPFCARHGSCGLELSMPDRVEIIFLSKSTIRQRIYPADVIRVLAF
jgi:hypothetical protein